MPQDSNQASAMRGLEPEQTNLEENLETGDHLVIYENSGRIVDMTLTRVEGNDLIGALTTDNLTPIPYSGVSNLPIPRQDLRRSGHGA